MRKEQMNIRLAGMSLCELRQVLHDELFGVFLPFWEKHGVDHENGGIMCSLDYDGTLVNSDKFLWFQGRAIWIYSFLYNHLCKDSRYLEIARKTKDFVLMHARQEDRYWAEKLSREGKVLKPYSGDTEGMYYVVEGLQEYAAATGDEQARDLAFTLFKKLFRDLEQPSFRYLGADFPYLWNSKQAVRPQGLWMVIVYVASQILSRWDDPDILTMADRAIDAIMNKHYNPEIGLNTEALFLDYTRPKEEAQKSRIGHSIEALWMVMEEATRRGDQSLWDTCAERVHRHLEVGWDHVYGGICEWVNVDHGGYQWPRETPVGTDLEFRCVGEYHYMKALWALNEALIATLNVYQRTGAEWAMRYFDMSYKVLNERFSQKTRRLPGYMLFADRRMNGQPHVARQDNYHLPRQLMQNILTLDRMIGRGSTSYA
jgi:mannose/cellobiose epimerase-like protein (N-acyl-D-glucosamine 2-epimerase family)